MLASQVARFAGKPLPALLATYPSLYHRAATMIERSVLLNAGDDAVAGPVVD